jgi:hypothetical protein
MSSPFGCAKTVRAGTGGLNFQSPPLGFSLMISPLALIP